MNAWKKTGQHWLLFVLANYHKILIEDIKEPLRWGIVEEFARKGYGFDKKKWDQIQRTIKMEDFHPKYPSMMRSEASWKRNLVFHESFDKVIYLYRNPFDVIISLYFYLEKDKLRQKLINSRDIEYYKDPLIVEFNHEELWKYIRDYILIYIQHLNQGFHHADVILKYEDLRENPDLFKPAFLLFYDEIDDKIFQKALEWGGYNQIHKIKPHHARNGSVNQYKEIMTDDMIEYIKKVLRDNLREKLMEVLKIE